MARQVFTVPVLVHIVADSAEHAVQLAYEHLDGDGAGVLAEYPTEINRLTVHWINTPDNATTEFGAVEYGYDLEDV